MNLRERLKLETRPEHEELEKTLDILSPTLTLGRLTTVRRVFFGFHQEFESKLRELHSEIARDYLAHRAKVGWFDEAFEARPFSMPWIVDEPSAVGAIYVVEGSTLGGQVITKHLLARGFDRGSIRYFEGYGEQTGAKWSSFLKSLESVPEKDGDVVLGAARQTFRALRSAFAQS